MRSREFHQLDRRCAFDRRCVRDLVALLFRNQCDHRARPQGSDALDDVPIGHAHAYEGDAWCRGRRYAESALTLKDADEPVEVVRIYAPSYAQEKLAVSMGGVKTRVFRGAAKR